MASGGQVRIPMLPLLAVGNRKGATVTRLLLEMSWIADADSARKVMNWGITYVNSDAVVALAFPDPSSTLDTPDWIARGQQFAVANSAIASSPGYNVTRKSLDLRSQRICRAEDDELYFIIDTDAITAGGVFFNHMFRTLVRLP